MASTAPSTRATDVFDQVSEAIASERGDDGVYLQAAHLLRRSGGTYSLVGLEAGGRRAVYHYVGQFASAIPFDEAGVHREDAETLARGGDARAALAELDYAWVHPEYRDALSD